jgi:hypothetical protein
MFYRLLLIGLLLLQAGCVGISLVTGTKQVELSKNIGRRIGDYGNNLSGITSAAVLAQWGPPDTKAVTESGELWTYKSDTYSWRGVQLWLIVPLPLLLPVRHHMVQLEFTDNLLTNYTIDNAREKFFGYFLMNGTSQEWQFGTEERTSGCHGYYGCY